MGSTSRAIVLKGGQVDEIQLEDVGCDIRVITDVGICIFERTSSGSLGRLKVKDDSSTDAEEVRKLGLLALAERRKCSFVDYALGRSDR